MEKSSIGSILWHDLTVPNAEEAKNFYQQVVGWNAAPHDMGEYHDFDISSPDGTTFLGICHARGMNAKLPPQWLIYVQVEDVARSAEQCAALGGKVLDGPRTMGNIRFCIIQDPAGAVLGIMSDEPTASTNDNSSAE